MPIDNSNPVLAAIFQRRSIRKYTEQPVEAEKLELLLQSAMAAPSAMNGKPWEFVVVTDPDRLALFRRKLIFGNRNAPAAILVCGSLPVTVNPTSRLFWVQDCSAAAENILLAAVGLGLSAVWVGVHPVPPFVKVVRKIAGLPAHVIPLGLIYVGYGAEKKDSRTQYDPDRVHWQVYSPRKVEIDPPTEATSQATTKE